MLGAVEPPRRDPPKEQTMTARFDPNVPFDPSNPTGLFIEGDMSVLAVTEHPAIGSGNLVIDPSKDFDISCEWSVAGSAAPIWLGALASNDWVVSAYVESVGPGDEKFAASTTVPVGIPALSNSYSATLTVPAGTLKEENPGDPSQSGVYKLVVTVFLDSTLGPVGYDMMGYAEGPIIKAENPL